MVREEGEKVIVDYIFCFGLVFDYVMREMIEEGRRVV